jgi:hypothetical protein
MTAGRRAAPGAMALSAMLAITTMAACGTTYYDAAVTVPPTGATTTTTLAPVADDTPLPELLATIADLMEHLDEQIVDTAGENATMARIDEVWAVADRQIRRRNPDDVVPFQQAIEMARIGVERRRPADASKGYRVLVTAIDAYDAAL